MWKLLKIFVCFQFSYRLYKQHTPHTPHHQIRRFSFKSLQILLGNNFVIFQRNHRGNTLSSNVDKVSFKIEIPIARCSMQVNTNPALNDKAELADTTRTRTWDSFFQKLSVVLFLNSKTPTDQQDSSFEEDQCRKYLQHVYSSMQKLNFCRPAFYFLRY